MSDTSPPRPGTIGWVDLTVPEAGPIRAFYEAVVGWSSTGLDMGGYEDYCMIPPGAESPVAGICHARGPNATLPAVWLVYLIVADLDASLKRSAELGGTLLSAPRDAGPQGRFAVIRDPAGAVSALFEPPRAQ